MILLTEKEGICLNCSKEDSGKTSESIALRIERPEEAEHPSTMGIQEEAKKIYIVIVLLSLDAA